MLIFVLHKNKNKMTEEILLKRKGKPIKGVICLYRNEHYFNYRLAFPIFKHIFENWGDKYFNSKSSKSIYSKPTDWGFKLDGTERVSDHWNFYTRGSYHCRTSTPVENNTHYTLARYNKSTGLFDVIYSFPFVDDSKLCMEFLHSRKTKEFIFNLNEQQRIKELINSKRVYCHVVDENDNLFTGVVDKRGRKYLRFIDNENNTILYNYTRYDRLKKIDCYLDNDKSKTINIEIP